MLDFMILECLCQPMILCYTLFSQMNYALVDLEWIFIES